MKRSQFTETEILYAIKQWEAGISVAELARKYGVSQKRSTTGARNMTA